MMAEVGKARESEARAVGPAAKSAGACDADRDAMGVLARVRDPPQTAESLAPCFRGDARLGAIERMSSIAAPTGRGSSRRSATSSGVWPIVSANVTSSTSRTSTCRAPLPGSADRRVGRQLAPFLRAHHLRSGAGSRGPRHLRVGGGRSAARRGSTRITTASMSRPPCFQRARSHWCPRSDPRVRDRSRRRARWRPWPDHVRGLAAGLSVQYRRLDSDEHRAATAAIAGQPVAAVCESFGRGRRPRSAHQRVLELAEGRLGQPDRSSVRDRSNMSPVRLALRSLPRCSPPATAARSAAGCYRAGAADAPGLELPGLGLPFPGRPRRLPIGARAAPSSRGSMPPPTRGFPRSWSPCATPGASRFG